MTFDFSAPGCVKISMDKYVANILIDNFPEKIMGVSATPAMDKLFLIPRSDDWMRYFLESLGYTIDKNILYQDNMSTLSLEKNGRISGLNCTKRIKAKYYLVQDKYNQHKIDLKYCPTNTIWADVLTKPLQGQKFREMQSFFMNCPLDYSEI